MSGFIVGLLTVRWLSWLKSLKSNMKGNIRRSPGPGTGPGTYCFPSGSWSYKATIDEIVDPACTALANQALSWVKQDNQALANPSTMVQAYPNGTVLLNEEGFRQNLSVQLIDAYGARGGLYYSQEACALALRSVLYDCSGANGDTRGGIHFFGNDGVVAYGVDPICVGTPEKRCGANT